MKNAKRFLAVFLSFAMALSLLPVLRLAGAAAAIVESGPCGDTAAYTLDEEGNLVITGTGTVMQVFSDRADIRSLVVGEGITDIAGSAFARCTELTSAELPDTLAVIPYFLFSHCIELRDVRFPAGLTEIQGWAFASCALADQLVLPPQLQKIEMGAFNNIRSSSIYIPASVTEIDGFVFETYWGSLREFVVDENNPVYCSYEHSLYSKDRSTLIYYVSQPGQTVFEIPDNVTRIETGAFEGSCQLEAFSVADDHPYFSVSDGVLFNKTQTVLLRYPSDKAAYSYAVPSGVTTIGYGAFNGAYGLRHILLPDSLTTIGDKAFGACGGLKSLRVPDGVSFLGNWMLHGCASLKEITLSSGLRRVGDQTFSECTALESVYFLGTEEEWNAISVSDDTTYNLLLESGEAIGLTFGDGNENLRNATVYFTFAKGDVDLDGHVTPADARMILRGAVGLDVVSFVRSDLDNDGNLTAADARLAMRVCAFLEDPSSMECATPVNPTFTEFEGGTDKITVDASFEDDTMTLTFAASDFAGTTDGEMFISFDPAKLEYVSGSVTMDPTDAD